MGVSYLIPIPFPLPKLMLNILQYQQQSRRPGAASQSRAGREGGGGESCPRGLGQGA